MKNSFGIPLGADKKHDASKGAVSVFSNDKESMTSFEAPANFLKIKSNHYFKVRMAKDERRKWSEKRFIQSASAMRKTPLCSNV